MLGRIVSGFSPISAFFNSKFGLLLKSVGIWWFFMGSIHFLEYQIAKCFLNSETSFSFHSKWAWWKLLLLFAQDRISCIRKRGVGVEIVGQKSWILIGNEIKRCKMSQSKCLQVYNYAAMKMTPPNLCHPQLFFLLAVNKHFITSRYPSYSKFSVAPI